MKTKHHRFIVIKLMSIAIAWLFPFFCLQAQENAPANMSSYRGKNGSSYIFSVTGVGSGRFWGGENNVYTDDSPINVAAVHAGLVKAGETKLIKVTVMPGRSSYPSITRNGLTSIKYGEWKGSYQLSTAPQGSNNVAQAPSNLKGYRGQNGSIYTFRVTGKTGGRIWGGQNNIYTDDSELATAAVHAGVVKVGQTGEIRVKVMSGQSSYQALTRNGVASNSYGKYDGSYQILNGSSTGTTTNIGTSSNSGTKSTNTNTSSNSGTKSTNTNTSSNSGTKSTNTGTVQQAPTNLTQYRGKNGSIYTFRVTGKSSGRIWGGQNNIYTDDSELATAAVHAGVVKVGQTVEIQVKIVAGQTSYPALTRNGVTSIKYGSWHGSYQILNGSSSNTTTNPGVSSNSGTKSTNTGTVQQAPTNLTNYRGKNGTLYTFRVTGKSSGRIWGGQNNIYTDDSELATAAVHAGVVKVGQTAEIRVKIMAGQSSYPTLTRNGVTSIKYGSWHGSYQILK